MFPVITQEQSIQIGTDQVPLNYNGYSPAIIPTMGWRLDKTLSVHMNFLGTAAVMLMVNKKF